MKTKVYYGIDHLPCGTSDNRITDGCIVLEGGGFRGVYSEGVLDALMEAGINMSCTIGVSAGALNGANYVSGQIGRSARINLRYRHDKQYVGLKTIKHDKGIIGFSFVLNDPPEVEPFNYKRFFNSKQRFIAVTTNCITGQTEYFEKNQDVNIFQAIRASASLPYVSKPVDINGVPHLDGGCSCKIPYQWAIDNNFDKIIVVRTRPQNYRKNLEKSNAKYSSHTYRKYPKLSESLQKSDEEYNMQCDEIEKLEKEGRLFIISPSKSMKVGRLETNMDKLGLWYYMGYYDTKSALEKIRCYLDK